MASKLDPTAVSSKSAAPSAPVPPKYLQVSPATGTRDASPSDGISVTAVKGSKISAVTVKASGGNTVAGTLGADGTSWRSTRSPTRRRWSAP